MSLYILSTKKGGIFLSPSDPIWGQLLLQVVLISINAFFASAEIAVISLNEGKLRLAAEEGDRKSEQLLSLMANSAAFLSTIQVGITLAGFLASAFAADTFSDRLVSWLVNVRHWTAIPVGVLNNLCVVLITIILSYFTLVFGELVPKRIAMQRTDKVARAVCGFILVLGKILRPVIWLLSVSTNGVLRLVGINPSEDSQEVTEEEIRMMVDIGEESGTIEANEKEMIENIFEFNNTCAADIMVHRTDVAALWVDETTENIIRTIEETGLSRFPVYEENIDEILGTVSTREFLLNLRRAEPMPLRQLLRPAFCVPESVRADLLFREMQKKKVHMAIVVDEYGGTSGIVTLEDLLEEIVGNIYDEFDHEEEKELQQLSEDQWKIAGSVDLDTLSEALNVEFPDQEEFEFDTLGGLVFSQLTAIPPDGSQPEVECFGMHIKVLELTDHRVEWAQVTVLPKEENEDDEDKKSSKPKDKE